MEPEQHPEFDDHQKVLYCNDHDAGLRGIIAIHNTSLGPAIGGCRMLPYASDEAALRDVLRLSRGMTYKCAMGRIPFGGGKSVIIADPARDKTPQLFHAMGDFVESLGGQYITSFDSGTTMDDIRAIGEKTTYVGGVGRDVGNASASTAYSVLVSIRTAVRHRLGAQSLEGVRVAVQGLGNVGSRLVNLLLEEGASVTACDMNPSAVDGMPDAVTEVAPEAIIEADVDVLAPCALGAVLSEESISGIQATVIAGGANNQLATESCGELLREAGILYVPDYVANGGGIIDLHYQINGGGREQLKSHLDGIGETLEEIFQASESQALPTNHVADQIAERRFRTPTSTPARG